MPIYELRDDRIHSIPRTHFASEGIKERDDLQRLLRDQPDLIDEGLMVLAEEFGDWTDSSRRIDLLCLDSIANLVVVELKRTADGGHMELQALRYAAMVSTMTFDQAVMANSAYLKQRGREGDARDAVLEHLGWEEPEEDRFAVDIRVVLVSEDFSREITTAVMWLNERDLDIRCVRLSPYLSEGRVLLDIQQVIPLPEAADYQVRIKEKEQRKRSSSWQPKTMPEIWKEFENRCPPDEVALARDLYAWFDEQFDEVFPTANAFAPMLNDKSRNRFFLKVMFTGAVEIWFVHLAKNRPFEDEALREEVRRRFNAIEGVEIDADRIGGKPTFPLSALASSESLAQFKEVALWMRDMAQKAE